MAIRVAMVVRAVRLRPMTTVVVWVVRAVPAGKAAAAVAVREVMAAARLHSRARPSVESVATVA